MRRFFTLFVTNLKLSYRDRQNLVFAFLLPVLLMTLLGFAFGSGVPFSLKMGVVDHDHSELSKGVIKGMREVVGVTIFTGGEREELKKLRDGDRSVVMVLPPGFQYGMLGLDTGVKVYEDRTDPTNVRVALTMIRNALAQVQEQAGQSPFVVQRVPVLGQRFRYIDFMTPGIMGMAIMQLGVLGSLSTLVPYRESGLLRRIRVTPLPLWAFVGSQAIVRLMLAAMQVAILTVIAIVGFGVRITGSFPALLVVAILGSAVFVNVGIIASAGASTFQTAVTLGLVVTVPMIFLCGVFFPIEAMPKFLHPLIYALPLTHLNVALREVVTRGATLFTLSRELLIMGGLGVGSFIAALWAFRWE